jgi:hypothetical protein
LSRSLLQNELQNAKGCLVESCNHVDDLECSSERETPRGKPVASWN